jgi:hypothetical protein
MEETPFDELAPKPKPLRVVPKSDVAPKKRFVQRTPNAKTITGPVKKIEWAVSPHPGDPTKGKLDMTGTFRFTKAADAFEWARTVWSDPVQRLHAYVYRQLPVTNFSQSSVEPNPELGHNISKWESWPFGSSDFHVGMYERFGSGTYMILFLDAAIGKKIAKIEDWELPNYEHYPPKVRVDDIVIDSTKNKPFIAWARQAGCLFPNDLGYTPGKFVHIETQRHRNTTNEEEGDYMTKGPLGQAVEEITGGILRDAVDNFRNPQPATNPAVANLDHLAAKASIDMVTETAKDMVNQKGTEQNALLALVTTLVTKQPAADTSQQDGFKFAIESIREMAKMQIDLVKADRDSLANRLERLESRESRAVAVAAAPVDEQDRFLNYLDKQAAIMERLGYTQRGSRGSSAPAPEEKSLVATLVAELPGLLMQGMQAYGTHMQVQLRIAELQAGKAATPFVQQPPPMQPPQAPPPPQSTQEQRDDRINEALRREVGPDFDLFVANFHQELAKMDTVISAKYLDGIQLIIKDQAETLEDQTDIMADHGALLADWYKEIPGNGHHIMISYKDVLLNVLKTYKPIWDVMSKTPVQLQQAFLDGFCDPSRLDDEDGDPNEVDMAKAPKAPEIN